MFYCNFYSFLLCIKTHQYPRLAFVITLGALDIVLEDNLLKIGAKHLFN